MFWKDDLARRILNGATSYDQLIDLKREFNQIRVKTIDVKGQVCVIQFERDGEWLKPREWAMDHLIEIEQRYTDAHQRLVDMGRDPSQLAGRVGPKPRLNPVVFDDLEGIPQICTSYFLKLRESVRKDSFNDFDVVDARTAAYEWRIIAYYEHSGHRIPINWDYAVAASVFPLHPSVYRKDRDNS